MKKILMPLITGIAGLIIPVAGMTISPIRNLILGLAPEEAILQLADKIDENRNFIEQNQTENIRKTSELENIVAEQQKIIENQKTSISKLESDMVKNSNEIVNQRDCAIEISTNCNREQWKTREAFEKYIKEEALCSEDSGISQKECEDIMRKKSQKYFDNCQKSLICQ